MAAKPKREPKKEPRIGRPKIDEADRRNVLVHVLVTKTERQELQIAADEAARTVSTWVRLVALERARALAAEKEVARKREQKE